MKRAIIVQGLGFGDEGKGATVDFLTREFAADLVVRYCGGSQAAHNVVLPDGRRHIFSQWGAGTLAGAATYLADQVVINPPAMHKEAEHLRQLIDAEPFDLLTVHPRALVSTVYHQQLNRLRELSRGAARHGSCGQGIGETRHDWLVHGQDAIFAADLKDRELLRGKLELLRQRTLLATQEFISTVPADEQWRLEILMEPARHVADEFQQMAEPMNLDAEIPCCQTAIFEGAQGVLLDEWRGFHPYTTWSTVTLHHALGLVEQYGAEELCTLGITRAYQTRHGAGPFPTASPELNAHLTDHGNPTNAWQGQIRHGWLDLVLLRYAIEVAGGALNGLVVNCLDELRELSPRVCTRYRTATGDEISRLPIPSATCLATQQDLTHLLEGAEPIFEATTPNALIDILRNEVAPIAITSSGPTYKNRDLTSVSFVQLRQTNSDRLSGISTCTGRAEATIKWGRFPTCH